MMDQTRSYCGDCNKCPFWRGMANRKRGVRVPGGSGKCTAPGGPAACQPHTVRGKIGGGA